MFLRKIIDLKNTLLFRLTALYALAFLAVSLVSFLVFYFYVYSLSMERMDEELLDEVEIFAEIMAAEKLAGVQAKIVETAEMESPEEEFYRLMNFDGDILAATDMSAWGTVAKADALSKLPGGEQNYIVETISVSNDDDDFEARLITAVIGPQTVLQIGETLEEVEEYLEIFRNLLLILIGILIVLSSIIGWLLARQAVVDMKQVSRTAEEISSGAYDKRVRIKGQFEEIQKLGDAFNKMLDQIENLLKSMKEINDNIAHDLRSPLARIRGIAEMTLTDAKSIRGYKDMAVSTMEECDALIGMINTMLDITEAEAGVNGARVEEFDFVALLSEACELFRPIASEKKMALKTKLPESLTYRGDKKKMQRVVTNILENSIKYTPEQGTVAVSAADDDGVIQVVFEDTGVGISESDLPHIFERFYRCDRSRSQGGVGLGLSLARAYMTALNGVIQVKSRLNEGSVFILRFPQSLHGENY
jgi:signal transduction histidine kinase